jgi:hypothetical protein
MTSASSFGLRGKPTSSSANERQRLCASRLSASEIMTLLIHFHQSHYRHFKGFYLYHVHKHLGDAFRHLVSYTRFVALMPSVLIPLTVYLHTRRRGTVTGIGFIDSTPLVVCHNRRIRSHKVFKKVARRGEDLDRVVLWVQVAPSGQ